MRKNIFTNYSFQTPVINNDDIASDYEYTINYGQTNIKMHNKNDDTPERKIIFPNSASLLMLVDLPHGIKNKLNDYALNYGDLEYEATESIFKESYLFNSYPGTNQLDYIVSSSGDLTLITQSNGDVNIMGKDYEGDDIYSGHKEPYGIIKCPFLTDTSGSIEYATLELTTKKIKGKNTDIFRYTVDDTWLQNATYPVVLDPSVLIISSALILNFYGYNNHRIARTNFGDLITAYSTRSPNYMYAVVGQGDSFATSSTIQVTSPAATRIDFQNLITLDDRVLLIYIYNDGGGSNSKAMCSISYDGGYTWETPVNITDDTTGGGWYGNGLHAEVDQDGTVWVIGQQNSSYGDALVNSTDKGETWNLKSATDGGVGFWYPTLCEDTKERRIICYGATDPNGFFRVWNIDADAWESSRQAMNTTGLPIHSRILPVAMATDNDSNTFFWGWVLRGVGSYTIYEWTFPSGTVDYTSATGVELEQGQWDDIPDTARPYGSMYCDQQGVFHRIVHSGNIQSSAYISSRTFNGTDDWKVAVSGSNIGYHNQDTFNVGRHPGDETISEFHIIFVDYDADSGNRYIQYHDDIVLKVGPTFMGMIG